jgi:formylglycine-generating enzyme required for sulfatase activity
MPARPGPYEWTEKADRNWRSPGFRQTDRDPVVCVSYIDAQVLLSHG